jgi:hypothetical protein
MQFQIDLDNDEQVKLAKQFMSDLKGTAGVTPVVTAPVETVRTTKEVADSKQPATASPAAAVAKPASGITLDMISKKTAEKVADNREVMKEKLTEMGVARAGELDPSAYKEYYDFLVAL